MVARHDALGAVPGRPAGGVAVDRFLRLLVHLVLDEGWSACDAARRLRDDGAGDVVLRRVRIRMSSHRAGATSRVEERAQVTLQVALGESLGALGPWEHADPSRLCARCRAVGGGCEAGVVDAGGADAPGEARGGW